MAGKSISARTTTAFNQTYEYMINEVIPEDKEGIIYDGNSYTVTAKVKDDGDGTFAVEVTVKDNSDGTIVTKRFAGVNDEDHLSVKFENKYNPDVASAVIKGEKNLKGRTLEAEEFEFSLIKGRKVVETVKNKADGTFTFSALTFDKPGTYKYTVVENNTKAEGIIYDKTEYKVVIKVADKGGFLEAKINVLDDGDPAELEFNNRYAPENPEILTAGGSDTGDYNNIGMYIIILVGAFLAIVGIVVYRRKRR